MDTNTSYGAVVTQPHQVVVEVQDAPAAPVVKDLNATLENLEEIIIHQHLDALEVCMGWERNNRYSVYSKNRKQFLYIFEAAQCYARQCYGSLRELSLIVADNEDNRLLQMYRPLRCSSRCCYTCCHLQEMQISLPSKQSLGKIIERWSCCIPHYEILDEADNLRFVLKGSLCHFRCCCAINFSISNSEGKRVSSISSTYGGCSSIIGAFNEFTINYSSDLSSDDKIRILAASFLVDFNYFQRHGKCF